MDYKQLIIDLEKMRYFFDDSEGSDTYNTRVKNSMADVIEYVTGMIIEIEIYEECITAKAEVSK